MNTKHTPGPWYAVDYGGFISMQNVDSYSGNDLLNIEACPEAEANAKLIAAAPEMFEMLKENLEALKNLTGRECYDSGHFPCICTGCQTKKLIQKIEGEEVER